MDKSSIGLASLFESYALFNRSEGRSPATITWYQDKLRQYLRWLEEKGYPTCLGGFDVDRVREFVIHEQERDRRFERNPFTPEREQKLSGHTIRGYVRTLKAFSTWLFEDGYIETNLLQRYKLPKARLVQPQWLSQEEIERLLKIFDRKTTLGVRDYAIIVTLLDTGLRCAELCNLTLDNADLDTGQLNVVGKGNKERTVPVGVRAVRALRRYRDHFRPPIEKPELLLTVDGHGLTVQSVQQMMRRAKMAASIPRLHVHLLRHTFAIHYLMAGGDAFSLQRILGHSSLDVTKL
jgi:site-specific recombinase XerD